MVWKEDLSEQSTHRGARGLHRMFPSCPLLALPCNWRRRSNRRLTTPWQIVRGLLCVVRQERERRSSARGSEKNYGPVFARTSFFFVARWRMFFFFLVGIITYSGQFGHRVLLQLPYVHRCHYWGQFDRAGFKKFGEGAVLDARALSICHVW